MFHFLQFVRKMPEGAKDFSITRLTQTPPSKKGVSLQQFLIFVYFTGFKRFVEYTNLRVYVRGFGGFAEYTYLNTF